MTPHPAFDAILRETMAEVEAAEAIDAADARQAQDDIEQLRLRAAHLITVREGGPWATGAVVQFAKEPSPEVAPRQPTMDIRFPQSRPRGEAPAEERPAGRALMGGPERQGRRIPDMGKRAG